ncbi:hypothetical protein, partial [Streptomyces sp. TRM68367]|uniref:hypothetical protein n=1 Tax=Streptomyces sp. TRM68367 TaxID=2758415 RepID=UPI0021D1AE8F
MALFAPWLSFRFHERAIASHAASDERRARLNSRVAENLLPTAAFGPLIEMPGIVMLKLSRLGSGTRDSERLRPNYWVFEFSRGPLRVGSISWSRRVTVGAGWRG